MSGAGGNSGGLGLLLQRLRAAVPLSGWGYAAAPDTPDNDEEGTTGAGDVEGLLGSGGRVGGGGGWGLDGRVPMRLLEAYGEKRRRLVGRFKVRGVRVGDGGVWDGAASCDRLSVDPPSTHNALFDRIG